MLDATKMVINSCKCIDNVELADFNPHLLIGRVLSDDIICYNGFPITNTSIVDGYGCKQKDLLDNHDGEFSHDGEFRLTGWSRAGDYHITGEQDDQGSPTCCYVTTGGSVPLEFDVVIPMEHAKLKNDGGIVTFKGLGTNYVVPKNNNIRLPGCDIRCGEVVMRKGIRITGAGIGILAMSGAEKVPVYRKVKVGVMSTGNEVEDLGDGRKGETGRIWDCNRPMLIGELLTMGGFLEVVDLGIVRDLRERVEEGFEKGLEGGCDVIVSTGGVSVGDKDFVKVRGGG